MESKVRRNPHGAAGHLERDLCARGDAPSHSARARRPRACLPARAPVSHSDPEPRASAAAMGRRRGGAAPRARAPPPARTQGAPPPARQQQSFGGGLMSGLMGTVAQGMAFGAGSEVAHQGVRSMMGGSSGHAPAPEAAASAPAPVADACAPSMQVRQRAPQGSCPSTLRLQCAPARWTA